MCSLNNILGMSVIKITGLCQRWWKSMRGLRALQNALAPRGRTRISCILMGSFSQDERRSFFSPLLGESRGDCAAPRLSPDASSRGRLHITPCELAAGSDAPAGL